MSKPQILLLGEIDHAKKEWSELSSIGELIEPKARSRQEFIEECKSGAFDKVLAAYRTFASVAITGLFDEELISVLPKSLKYIAHNGTESEAKPLGEVECGLRIAERRSNANFSVRFQELGTIRSTSVHVPHATSGSQMCQLR
ncbi:glyoxylate reductase [Clarireedia jacksonii]